MNKIIVAAAGIAALLVATGCSSSDDGGATSAPATSSPQAAASHRPGDAIEIFYRSGKANVTVGALEWKSGVNGEPLLSTKVRISATEDTFPASWQNFRAVTRQGESLTYQPGGPHDDLMQEANVPAGEVLEKSVAWTDFEGREVATVSFLSLDTGQPLATWEVAMPTATPAAAPEATVEPEPAPVLTVAPPVDEVDIEYTTTFAPQAPVGLTGAPNVAPAPLLDKTIDHCMNGPSYQRGTTMFTDGTTGWTEQCANGG